MLNVVGLEGYSSILLLIWVAASWPAPSNKQLLLAPGATVHALCNAIHATVTSDPRTVGHNPSLELHLWVGAKVLPLLGLGELQGVVLLPAGRESVVEFRDGIQDQGSWWPCVFANV